MINILEHIYAVLKNAGLQIVNIGELPTDKDACVALFQHDGDRQNYFGGSKIDDQLIRVVFRNPEFSKGLKDIHVVKTALNNFSDNVIIGMHIKALDTYLGMDEKRRHVWDMTFITRY